MRRHCVLTCSRADIITQLASCADNITQLLSYVDMMTQLLGSQVRALGIEVLSNKVSTDKSRRQVLVSQKVSVHQS